MDILEPVWNGTLEHDGLAPGLSNYCGRSTLHHSASWAQAEALEHGECARVPMPATTPKRRPAYLPAPVRAQRLTPQQRSTVGPRAVELRHKGVSWRAIARNIGLTVGQVRSLVRAA